MTTGQIITWILAVSAGITCVSGALNALIQWYKSAKKPVDELEATLRNHEVILDKHNRELEELSKSSRITQKALLALLSHNIDGNDVKMMKEAKQELQEFLIDK